MPKRPAPSTTPAGSGWLPLSPRSLCGLSAGASACRWLALPVILGHGLAVGQEALRNSLAGEAAAEARSRQQQSEAYNIKSGDFRLRLTPSLGLDWNDNINTAQGNVLDDYIVRPTTQLSMSYPLTEGNILRLSVTAGYQAYLQHSDYSTWYVQSGSALTYDIYVKDFWINLHDRFSYVQDASQQASVANTGTYGTAQNTVGFNTTWDLQDATLSLGYDHQNFFSTSGQFDYTDRASELVVSRGGLRFHPSLTAGLEGTFSYTVYDRSVLNDNTGYSAGVYADWQPGHYLHIQPRFGYTIYDFRQTSQSIPASDQDAWYADLTATHEISDTVSYSLSAGHQLTPGTYGDTTKNWYVRPTLHLHVVKDLTLSTSFSYEHGTQELQTTPGSPSENYDWLTWALGLSYPLMKRLTLGVNYRLTWRTSNEASREYTQNLVGLQLTYNLP